MGYSEYRDLTPKNDINNGEEYIKALDWAFENKKIKNIALAGPYGSGKSSIIETYLHREEERSRKIYTLEFWNQKICILLSVLKFWKKENKLAGKYLKISMATFIEGHNQSNNDGKINVNPSEVEEGILKQLFYKVNHEIIPQSRYRKLHSISYLKMLQTTFLVELIIILLSVVPFFDFYKAIWGRLFDFTVLCNLPSDITIIMAMVLYFIVGIGANYLYRLFFVKYHVKEVQLPINATIKEDDESDSSVFNKNLDEIMYFFESTPYRVVFFEDLDRLEDRKIFVHLRELNNLLNNDDVIKDKPIVFVYAIKDDIFTKEDRTKFFDFIIPVIPVINSTNSGEILLEMLAEAKNNNVGHNISRGFILDIAPYISDMRMLQNIYNEFLIYKNMLRTGQELSLSDEHMMAMIIFKNLYPNDFSNIQQEEGIIKEAFLGKQSYVEKRKKEFQKEIDDATETINNAQEDVLQSVRELKYAMLVDITNGQGIVRSFQQYGGTTYSSTKIMQDDFDFKQLAQKNYNEVQYVSLDRYYDLHRIPLDNISLNKISKYIKRWENLKKYHEQGLVNLQEKIAELKRKQHNILGESLQSLIENYSSENVLSREVRENKLLVFLLRRGYINEQYANYINYFKGNSITAADMNFILAVKSQEPQAFDYRLTKVDMVVLRLQDYEFEQKAIYNFQLLEQLLKEGQSTKLDIFIKQLADEEDISWQFIDEFTDKTSCLDKFIRILAQKWLGMWDYVSHLSILTYERQLKYLKTLLGSLSEEELLRLNKNGNITKFFEDHVDILQQLNEIEVKKLSDAIDALNVSFENLYIEGVPKELLDYVFENSHYVLNEDMVKAIILHKNASVIDNFSAKPYSSIIRLGYEPLIQRVREDVNNYLTTVVFNKTNISDDVKDIIDLFRQILSEKELCIQLIKQEQFILEKLSECLTDEIDKHQSEVKVIWETLVENKKLAQKWENIYLYWQHYKLDAALKRFIENNIAILVNAPKATVDDLFIKDFIQVGFKYETYEELLPVLPMSNFDLKLEDLPEDILRIMVECNYFSFTVSRYQSILAKNFDIAIDFIINNQEAFRSSVNEIQMTASLLEELLFEPDIQSDIREELFTNYAASYMTEKIAENMNSAGFSITKEIFDKAWNTLNSDVAKENLMYHNLTLLNSDDMEHCFSELEDYSNLVDRSSRRLVELDVTANNEKLVQHLKYIGYITSGECKEKDVYDKATKEKRKIKIIRCWIKAK